MEIASFIWLSVNIINECIVTDTLGKSGSHCDIEYQPRVYILYFLNKSWRAEEAEKAPKSSQSETRTRLLVSPYWTRIKGKSKFYQVDLETGTITRYPHLNLFDVMDMLYLPSLDKLLVSTYKPARILSVSIDVKDQEVLTNAAAMCMIADDGRQLLFTVTPDRPKRGFSRMDFKGGNKKFVPSPKRHIYSMVVDTKLKKLYATSGVHLPEGEELLEGSYDMKEFKRLDKGGSHLFALTMDPVRRILIYGKKKAIYKRSVFNSSSEMIISRRRSTFWKFRFIDNKMYITYAFGKYGIAVWNKTHTRILVKSIPDYSRNKLLICTIP